MAVAMLTTEPAGHCAHVLALGRWTASGQYQLVHAAVALDNSGEWAADGSHTCAQWIASALDIEMSTAREWLRIGRALAKLQHIDAAVREGRISYSKARALTRVATVENEVELCDIAERVPAGQLGTALAAWLSRNEEPEDTERRQQDARSLTWRTEPDGMVWGTFRLPPAQAAVLTTAVDQWVLRNRPTSTLRGESASADAGSPRNVRWASMAQQRADGLTGLVAEGGTDIVTEVIVHVRADGCSLDDGTPIAGTIVERIAPLAFIRALIHDADSRPINASGRQRHPTTRQKRVVRERDRRCVDCGGTAFMQYDHVPPFEVSRRTLIDELEGRCWTCHTARHAEEKDYRSSA